MPTPTRSHALGLYDDLEGPDLDATRWTPARLPLPTGDVHVPLDPDAQVTVGEGEVRVTIPRFTLAHDRFQAVDSAKHLTVSTQEFELPPDGPASFAVEQAVENIGGEPADFDDDFTRLRTCPLDRGLERRRPDGLRGAGRGDPRPRPDRFRDLDDAADPGRSQPIA
jgi:hypothetical protein